MAEIKLDKVSKSYGSVSVMDELSLAVDDGEFIVIVGPSGCGKSTLLRMIAGLETITGGDLYVGGKRANDLPPQKRNMSMVFQTYALYPHMTVEENISFGPRIRKEKPERIKEQVAYAASILNLTEYLQRKPSELSGGQRQRVAMGRAIVHDPDVFLFDEPLSNLDAHLRMEMRTEIKALHQKLNTTIVYVTHDQIEAMTMADRIVIMNSGRIEQVGTPLELYDTPVNTFVAGFLGSPSMSFFEAIYCKAGGGGYVELADGTQLETCAQNIENGYPVTVGIRPDAFLLTDKETCMRAQINVIEPTGTETLVFGSVNEQQIRCLFRDRPTLAPGDQVRLDVAPENLHLFDQQTGVRI